MNDTMNDASRSPRPIRLLAMLLAGGLLSAIGCGQSDEQPMPLGPQASMEPAMLFDGTSHRAWKQVNGLQCQWQIIGEQLIILPGAGSIRTVEVYRDFTLELEFFVPALPPEITGQARGNSGVYLQGRYEVQILDSWGLPASDTGCGALYDFRAPSENAAAAPNTWQRYRIEFAAARFDRTGAKLSNARISVHHNDVLIHDDVELSGPTGQGDDESAEPGPVVLQDHGSRVRFRNIRIEPR
jgi:hypothetical protein